MLSWSSVTSNCSGLDQLHFNRKIINELHALGVLLRQLLLDTVDKQRRSDLFVFDDLQLDLALNIAVACRPHINLKHEIALTFRQGGPSGIIKQRRRRLLVRAALCSYFHFFAGQQRSLGLLNNFLQLTQILVIPLAIQLGLLLLGIVVLAFKSHLFEFDLVSLDVLLNLVECRETFAPEVLQLLDSFSDQALF